MAYFKIGEHDYSAYTSALKVVKKTNYNAQTNAAGDTVVDYVNQKRTLEVEIISLADGAVLKQLLADVDAFNVLLSFRDPRTGALAEGVNCVIPDTDVEYYTIQQKDVRFKKFKLKFTEL
jgi:hypothetical protein